MRRRRPFRSVQILVSSNFYNLLEQEKNKLDNSYFKKTRTPQGRYKTTLSFPLFTELIHKDLIFSKCKRRKL